MPRVVDLSDRRLSARGKSETRVEIVGREWADELTADDVTLASWPSWVEHIRVVVAADRWRSDAARQIACQLSGRCLSWSIEHPDLKLYEQVHRVLAEFEFDGGGDAA